ncbi:MULTISPECIES: class I SAM-dependent methyltransferase [unclassified Rhodanobacter]|uniref:class I SAM-dependent methyltransferase n=1 Tax=unclassified Rhodanobacter TaxID=2621553 RepID=UPI0009EEE179|nr:MULTISPECIES: class I SAM-dependent methyltransferase [unclassified Rhodanobacter]
MIESTLGYDNSYYQGNQQDRDRPALALYQRLVRRYIPPGPVVDFGCGMGHLLKRLGRDRVAAGVEASEWASVASRQNCPASTVYRSLDEIPTAAYAGIVSIHVVEHIEDEGLAAVLAQFKRILQPGGRLLIVTPDATGWASRTKGTAWLALTDPTHINLKGHAAWRQLFLDHGFTVLKEAADGLYDFPYPPRKSRLIDIALRGWPTIVQFIAGRLLLKAGTGESVIFLLGHLASNTSHETV